MILKELVNSPITSSSLVVYDPFREFDRHELVSEVIGLANADADGPRTILFGVNPAPIDGSGIVGIPAGVAAELKKAHRLVSALIEPTLDLAFVYDRINGKLVGALEIDGCDFGPYFVGQDFSDTLARGQCWVREGRNLRAVERADLMQNTTPEEPAKPELSPDHVEVSVGFNDQPDCQYVEIPIPDTSNPPFAQEQESESKRSTIGQVIKDTVSTVTTQMLRIRKGGAAILVEGTPDGSATGVTEHVGKIYADAQSHYYFEEKAVKLELCIQNSGEMAIDDATIEFGFPRIPDFDVADRIHVSPFDKRSANRTNNTGYPEVERREDAIVVRSDVKSLAPGSTIPALRCPLRMAVGPGMQGKKLGIKYVLRASDKKILGKGGLKIRFDQVCA